MDTIECFVLYLGASFLSWCSLKVVSQARLLHIKCFKCEGLAGRKSMKIIVDNFNKILWWDKKLMIWSELQEAH